MLSMKLVKKTLKEKNFFLQRELGIISDAQLINFSHQLGHGPLKWDFGEIMLMQYKPNAKNYLYSREEVPLHWDGAFHQEPRYLIFNCLKSQGEGGETLFSNTQKLFMSFSKKEKSILEDVAIEYETEKIAHYGGKIKVNIIQNIDGKETLRFAERVKNQLNPVRLKIHSSKIHPEFIYRFLKNKIRSHQYLYKHSWREGDLLIIDNRYTIHGRCALGKNTQRQFKRIQVL